MPFYKYRDAHLTAMCELQTEFAITVQAKDKLPGDKLSLSLYTLIRGTSTDYEL